LLLQAVDLAPRRVALLGIQLARRRARQPPLRAVHHRGRYLQIAQQFGGGAGGRFRFLPLRLEKQLRLIQEALANRGRSVAPGRIQLAGLARIAVLLSEDGGHPLAVLQAVTRHRHQELHGYRRRNFAFAHLLLEGLRQKFHQRQPPRYPAPATVEPARQLLHAVAEALRQLGQQPAQFQRALVFG